MDLLMTSTRAIKPCLRGGWLRRSVRLLAVTVVTALLIAPTASVSFAGAASATGSQPPPGGGRACRGPSIQVSGTGVPILDRRRIQQAIIAGEATGRCVLLLGQFNVGFCVYCLQITRPVTLMGQADPTGPSPNPRALTVVRATGGVGLLAVNETPAAGSGLVRVSNIWWRGASLGALAIQNFYRGTLQLDHNRITDVSERLRFRFGIVGAGLLPGSHVLRGSLAIQDNYVDTTTNPFLPGDDNGIAVVVTTFDTIDISHNTVITKGESIEIEGNTGGSSYNVSDNIVSSSSRFDSAFANIVDTVGYPGLHGGHPAAVKLAGNDVGRVTIDNNVITSGGGSSTMVCIMSYMADPSESVHTTRFTDISGNRCTMSGIFGGLLAGWSGERPFFPQGSLDNAIIRNNTFVGTASFGITMMDFNVPLAPANDLVNTSNGNVFAGNDFSSFTPSVASLYFGASTHDNVFTGNPHGAVINLGTNNHIVGTP